MLNDTQSLVLTGLMAGSIFVFGLLHLLENFMILTALTVVFFVIILNIFYHKFNKDYISKKNKENSSPDSK